MLGGESVEIAWLSAKLGEKRNLILDLFARMRGLAGKFVPGGMKLSLFPKFVALFNQIADVRDEEMRIINQIEDIEAKHRLRRHLKCLERARMESASEQLQPPPELPAVRSAGGMLWLLTLKYLFRPENKPANTES